MKIFFYIIISFIGLFISHFISKKFNLYDFPDENKVHLLKTANTGGLALIFIILSSIAVNEFSKDIILIYILTISVIVIGFFDDLKNFTALKKIILISFPVTLFIIYVSKVNSLGFLFGHNINLGEFSPFFSFLCILLFINATNYMDGMDGLLSILTILSLTYIIIHLPQDEFKIFVPIIIFLLIFLFFNFGILPKQFLGDSGSLGIGFIIASLCIYYTQSLKFLEPTIIIWALSFFVYEFLTINIMRINNKKSLLEKDLNFIFNILSFKKNNKFSLFVCVAIKLFFLANGYVLNYYKLNDISIMLFVVYFFIYLLLRLKFIK